MSQQSSKFLTHPNGQITHVIDDDFTDPWKPCETILIQHGFGRHANFWYHWIPILSRHYRVIRRDARGHGFSSAPKPEDNYDYSLDTILSEIANTMDQLSVTKFHFLGESTSGMVAEAFAVKYPERLHSLITCASPTFLPPAAISLFSFGLPGWPEACRTLGSRGWGESLSRVPGTLSIPDKGYVNWWVSQVALSTGEGLAGYAEFLSVLDARPFLEQIRTPTLILAPAKSVATKLEEQRMVASKIQGSKLVVVNGEGHEIYVERPEDCQKAVLEFLAGLKRVA
ncbi:hypothetical protein V500_03253 [Pseudogymnoascus sp. VKM F-4518 (FW-2643)]|nr:hypothetical protein V500_03253 [Pseudogymnoascus sp. VKM F-4518 (FW-2643)]